MYNPYPIAYDYDTGYGVLISAKDQSLKLKTLILFQIINVKLT